MATEIHIHIPPGTTEVNITINGSVDSDQLDRIEADVSAANDALLALKAQIADTTADVLAKLQQLQGQLGTLDPEAQATLTSIVESVGTLDTSVGDADGSDTPPVPEV